MRHSTFINTCRVNAPFKSGRLMNEGIIFIETPTYHKATYDSSIVKYITYQEEGFQHYISKKQVTKNKGFISRKTVGAINNIVYSENLGLPYSLEEPNEELARRRNEILQSQGANNRVV